MTLQKFNDLFINLERVNGDFNGVAFVFWVMVVSALSSGIIMYAKKAGIISQHLTILEAVRGLWKNF